MSAARVDVEVRALPPCPVLGVVALVDVLVPDVDVPAVKRRAALTPGEARALAHRLLAAADEADVQRRP